MGILSALTGKTPKSENVQGKLKDAQAHLLMLRSALGDAEQVVMETLGAKLVAESGADRTEAEEQHKEATARRDALRTRLKEAEASVRALQQANAAVYRTEAKQEAERLDAERAEAMARREALLKEDVELMERRSAINVELSRIEAKHFRWPSQRLADRSAWIMVQVGGAMHTGEAGKRIKLMQAHGIDVTLPEPVSLR